jgi:hypothetical protein
MTAARMHIGSRLRGVMREQTAGRAAFAAGWLVLLASIFARAGGLPMQTADFVALLAIAFFLLTSGATLLVLDALRRGFGSLDAFFNEALARSTRRKAEEARCATPPPGQRAQRRGIVGDRPYVEYGDGTVAVETLLGVRLFNSLTEAQEFVGA